MNPELESQAEQLWTRAEKAYKFNSKFGIYPFREGGRLVDDFQRLSDEVPAKFPVVTTEEVYHNELKRRLGTEAVYFEHGLSGHRYTFDDVINLYGLDKTAEIDSLRDWLLENREETLDTIDRVYQATEVEGFQLPVPSDIPRSRAEVEIYAATHIENYHKKLAKLFEGLTKVGNYLRDITPVPTTGDRSYFDQYTKTLALSIPAICYRTEDQTPHVNERELILQFGHEGMGHGLNKVITEVSSLPSFLKRRSESVRATIESVGQYYEEVIFEDLKASPKTQKELGIEHKFEEIYQNQKDTQLITAYNRRLFHYAITVLADKELGDMNNPDPQLKKDAIDRRIALLSEVALYPGYAVGTIEVQRQNFDSQGNLNLDFASEIRYRSQSAQRVVETMQQKGVIYDGEGRSKIDTLLLTGYWTPTGLVENAQVAKP